MKAILCFERASERYEKEARRPEPIRRDLSGRCALPDEFFHKDGCLKQKGRYIHFLCLQDTAATFTGRNADLYAGSLGHAALHIGCTLMLNGNRAGQRESVGAMSS